MVPNVKDDDDAHPFPEDLAIEILQRLHVELLLRFKCVSKNCNQGGNYPPSSPLPASTVFGGGFGLDLFTRGRLLRPDFGHEVFGEIRGADVPSNACWSLILLDDSITLLTLGIRADYALWVMIEPGIWNKFLTFQCLSHSKAMHCGFWDSSTAIFLTRSSRLVSYDVKTGEMRHLGFRYQGQRSSFRVYYYRENLVTIKRGNG
ncbi:hypothetical protein RND71_041079 [Anisodus tanguticus]|uniref:Uncharacterized protein n=1 Tax=Anisodus tanguticus TaxID=243964 RepID=A0AAE1QWY6_9SOLA|nr:hypothetical protein RND71_041079 [Anisodus tanguticus]